MKKNLYRAALPSSVHRAARRRSSVLRSAVIETLERRQLLSSPIVEPAGPRADRPDYLSQPTISTAPEHFQYEYSKPKLVFGFDQPVTGVGLSTHTLTTLSRSGSSAASRRTRRRACRSASSTPTPSSRRRSRSPRPTPLHRGSARFQATRNQRRPRCLDREQHAGPHGRGGLQFR